MIFAQIKDGLIKNTIILNDLTQIDNLIMGYDYLKRIDNLINLNGELESPAIDWFYDADLKIYTDPNDPTHQIPEL